jgi:alkyldihydroxyacetonephosphate synthase
MVLAFESGDHPIEPWMKRAHECCVDHGARPEVTSSSDAHREGAAGAWRNAFIRMPFARERTIQRGIINDTFETAITWERFESFHDRVKAATERAIVEATGRPGQLTCRCTHNGGTVTHHHAVGREHRRWYDRQRPSLFAAALRAAKATLDPQGLLNPGVLIDPSLQGRSVTWLGTRI